MQVKQQQVESAEQHNASMNILHGAVKYAESWEEPGNESLVPWDHGGAGQALGPERPGWILAPWLWGHLGESSSSQSLNPLICKMKTKTLGKAGCGCVSSLYKMRCAWRFVSPSRWDENTSHISVFWNTGQCPEQHLSKGQVLSVQRAAFCWSRCKCQTTRQVPGWRLCQAWIPADMQTLLCPAHKSLQDRKWITESSD